MAFAAGAEPLATLADVRALSGEEAAKRLPVVVEGTVIYFDPHAENRRKTQGLVLHDGTAGCYVTSLLPLRDLEQIRPGARMRVEGVTNPKSYFPNIVDARMEVLGHGPLPEPRRITSRDLFSPRMDSEWVEIDAVVVGVEPGGMAFTMVVEIDGQTLKAEVPVVPDAEQRAAALMLRRVRLQAVVGTISNSAWQLTGRHFFVPSFDHFIPHEHFTPQEDPPLRAIKSLLRSYHDPDEIVRVRGVVTQQGMGGFHIRDGTCSTFVQAADPSVHPPGSLVEVEGLAAMTPFRPVLRAVRIKHLGQSTLDPPARFMPAKGLDVGLHGERVVVDCTFLTLREGLAETILQCRDGDSYFEAWLPGTHHHAAELRPGDQLRLTGICVLTTSRPMPRIRWADGFRMELAGPAAIEILRRAPWWTPERVLLAFGLAMAALCIVFIWGWQLRRRVAAQSSIIVSQMEQGIIKDERERIARELHDTLEQDLTGISMQLGNLARDIDDDPQLARERLSFVRRMLQHCRMEARASVSDLRNPHLLQRSLPEAMRESLPPAAATCAAAFHFELIGTPQPLRATTQNHLLHIAREAVSNAARHAGPKRIDVRLTYDSRAVTLEIIDDGTGFDVIGKPPAGHFGLIGMRERANKIRAGFTLQSTPGSGTSIRVELPWSSADEPLRPLS